MFMFMFIVIVIFILILLLSPSPSLFIFMFFFISPLSFSLFIFISPLSLLSLFNVLLHLPPFLLPLYLHLTPPPLLCSYYRYSNSSWTAKHPSINITTILRHSPSCYLLEQVKLITHHHSCSIMMRNLSTHSSGLKHYYLSLRHSVLVCLND